MYDDNDDNGDSLYEYITADSEKWTKPINNVVE